MPQQFVTLPKEILIEVFSNCSPETLAKLAQVNKLFNVVVNDHLIWQKKYAQHFPHLFPLQTKNNIDWHLFRKAYAKEYALLTKPIRKLFSLVKEGDIAGLKAAGLKLTDFDRCDKNNETLLAWAQKKGNQRLLDYFYQLVIEEYAIGLTVDVKKRDSHQRAILHWAILCNQPASTVELLIQQNADVNMAYTRCTSPLMLAAKKGYLDIVKVLLANHAYIDAIDILGRTPLCFAAKNGHFEVVKILLANGAARTKYGTTRLLNATYSGDLNIVKACLLANGANINATDRNGATLLLIAAEKGYSNIVKALLASGADINATNRNGATPFFIAAQNGYFRVVEALLTNGADINAACMDSSTALSIAKEKNHVDIVQIIKKQVLLNYHAKTNKRPDDHYKTSFTIFGHTFNFGYSAKQKKEAANALLSVIEGKVNKSCLKAHENTLHNGELGSIYRELEQSFGNYDAVRFR